MPVLSRQRRSVTAVAISSPNSDSDELVQDTQCTVQNNALRRDENVDGASEACLAIYREVSPASEPVTRIDDQAPSQLSSTKTVSNGLSRIFVPPDSVLSRITDSPDSKHSRYLYEKAENSSSLNSSTISSPAPSLTLLSSQLEEMFLREPSRAGPPASSGFFTEWTKGKPDPSSLPEMGNAMSRADPEEEPIDMPNFANLTAGGEDSLFLGPSAPIVSKSFFVDQGMQASLESNNAGPEISRSNSWCLPEDSFINSIRLTSNSFVLGARIDRDVLEEDEADRASPENAGLESEPQVQVMAAWTKSHTQDGDDSVTREIDTEKIDVIPRLTETSQTLLHEPRDDRRSLPSSVPPETNSPMIHGEACRSEITPVKWHLSRNGGVRRSFGYSDLRVREQAQGVRGNQRGRPGRSSHRLE